VDGNIYSAISMSSKSGNSISLDAAIRQAMALTKQNKAPTVTTMSSILIMVNPSLRQT
jgi:hypothetical protein